MKGQKGKGMRREEMKKMENKNKILDVRCEALNQTETEVDIYLHGPIVDEVPVNFWTGEKEEGEFIVPKKVRELVGEQGNRKLNIHLNSGGGNIYASVAIHNYLKQVPNDVDVYVDGTAGSGASIIAMAGQNIYMPKNTTMMIHRAAVMTYGNAEELRKDAETLDKFDETVLASYEDRFVGTIDELKELIAKETWLTAEECVTFGLADELLGEKKEENLENKDPIDVKASLLEKYKTEVPEKNILNNFKKDDK